MPTCLRFQDFRNLNRRIPWLSMAAGTQTVSQMTSFRQNPKPYTSRGAPPNVGRQEREKLFNTSGGRDQWRMFGVSDKTRTRGLLRGRHRQTTWTKNALSVEVTALSTSMRGVKRHKLPGCRQLFAYADYGRFARHSDPICFSEGIWPPILTYTGGIEF